MTTSVLGDRPTRETLLVLVTMLDVGIAPYHRSRHTQVGNLLRSLPSEEARAAKRKFRKLFRLAIERKDGVGKELWKQRCGLGLARERMRLGHFAWRRLLVFEHLLAQFVR